MPIIECAFLYYGDVGKTGYKCIIDVKIPLVSGTVTTELAQIRSAGKMKVDFIGSADVDNEWIASFINNTTVKDNIQPGNSH